MEGGSAWKVSTLNIRMLKDMDMHSCRKFVNFAMNFETQNKGMYPEQCPLVLMDQ
jgi:hypothetical protein